MVEFEITGQYDQVGFGVQVAKTPIYRLNYQIQLIVALCTHNLLNRQTDGQTNVMLIAKIG